MSFDPQTGTFRLNPRFRLQWEEAQGCHVLLYPEGLIRLNDSAAEILRRCSEPLDHAALVAELQRDYPDADSLPADVAEFLGHASREDWIVPVAEGSA